MEDKKWKEKIWRLNYTHMALLREAALRADGFARNNMGIPEVLLKVLGEAQEKILHSLAQIGMPLFKLQAEQVARIIKLASRGDDQKAQAMLMIGAIAREEECRG